MRRESIPADCSKTTSMNPVITSIFTADPSAHVWEDGRVYIYASHDVDPARGCDLMDRYHVFSSSDMVNWRDEGEILSSDEVNWGRPEGGFMWAPDCAYKNGTYYFYYPHPSGSDWNDTWKIGVATSGKPASGFTDQGYIPGLGGFAMIDPAVFVDEDNRAYMYYGGGGRCEGGELNKDMMSIKGSMKEMKGLEDFHEAAWVFKRNGVYYLTYADNLEGNNRMRYATSEHPLGPWTHRGIFLEPCGCSTTHGSVAEFKGRWYLFYHNQEISGEGTLRSVCIDELHFDEDGSIRTVVQTREGVNPIGEAPAPNPRMKVYGAADCVVGGGAAVEARQEGRSVITSLHGAGACCRFERVDGAAGGRAEIRITYATTARLAKLRLNVNGSDYSLVNAPSTGGDDEFDGCTGLTVRLLQGAVNSIVWSGGYGDISIACMTVIPLED
ncbi:family 43 glycosylhydrolase [Paenibacillus sp. GP183]|uniref:family 43 glycosylhydrolase n=1 Tax=Paenibacillus sp. GP183 TaxID=1882751 RepID=UPI00089AC54F|nr:family 43 glycosylhydrolase [Paenibacillus sp. GP183]SED15754.1 Glycosyl hydrolases family 43 [Paenibacillus sp. GP183]